MKASELIKRLQKLPPEMDVCVFDPRENFLNISEEEIMVINGYEETGTYDEDGEAINKEVEMAMIFTLGEE